jgi:hypothetical protein
MWFRTVGDTIINIFAAAEKAVGKVCKKVHPWILMFGPDEPIQRNESMKLSKPIKPGFRRPFTITPDEAVDVADNGQFLNAQNIVGDSTFTYDPSSTELSLKGWINGDGSTGDKTIRLIADGHVGAGDVPVTLDIDFTVAHPDATSLDKFVEGADEPIPPAQPT